MVFTNLAPNTEKDDASLACRLIFSPWRWQKGDAFIKLEKEIASLTTVKHTVSFESGRTALYAILTAAGITKGDEVLLQAYTCVAVPDPVLWAGATPVYVDIDETLTMSVADCEKKITPKSKAIIVQHTFGIPANLDSILALATRHSLLIIEDCAHALGATYHGKPVGSFGDAAFFSFGRDKVISSVFGGMAATNNPQLAEKIRSLQQSYPLPGFFWIKQQLLHPILMWLGKATYGFGGKIIIWLAKSLHLTSRAVYPIERVGGKPRFAGKRLSNALAILAIHQLKKLERFNTHRQKTAALYQELLSPLFVSHQLTSQLANLPAAAGRLTDKPIWLRYTIWTDHADRVKTECAKQGILSGDWYDTPIAPRGVSYERIGYKLGSCPVAEKIAARTINLPTDIHISENDAQKICNIITTFYGNSNTPTKR